MNASKGRVPPRYRRLALRRAPSMDEVRDLAPLISGDQAGSIATAILSGADALRAGLTLATKSGAWLERKAGESSQAGSTLAEIQLVVAAHADRMEAVAALLRAAETRAQLVLLSTASSRHAYSLTRERFLDDLARR